MKLTFKKAKAYLEAGKPFKAKGKNGDIYTFVFVKDGRIYDNDSNFSDWTEISFNGSFQFISFLPRKIHKVGDKVIITDDIKEAEGWNECEDSFPDMRGEIERVNNWRNGVYYIINSYWIGAEFVIADTEEETMPEMDEIKKVFDEFVEKTNKLFK